jgi:hypothetical protein
VKNLPFAAVFKGRGSSRRGKSRRINAGFEPLRYVIGEYLSFQQPAIGILQRLHIALAQRRNS